jgi:hypothetical protein
LATFYYSRRNDTVPITDTLEDYAGIAVNLAGAAVRFHASDRLGATIVNSPATGPNGGGLDATGQVRYAPIAADTAVAGTFFVEWQVTFASGVIETWLQQENAIWIIFPDLA